MRELRRILVGVDLEPGGSDLAPGSRRALEQTLWLGERTGARVVLLHSTWRDRYLDPLTGGLYVVSEGPPPAGADAIGRAAERLRAAGLAVDVALDEDRPHRALLARAEREGADLVVVGKRSRVENGRRLGSVSRKVVHGSSVPVWIVQPEHVLRAAAAGAPPARVVAASDFAPAGRRAVEAAAWIAAAADAELHVVHAVPSAALFLPDGSGELPPWTPLDVRSVAAAATRRLEREVAATPLAGRARVHVEVDDPRVVIRGVVERVHADLLVLGGVSRAGAPGLLVGSTAELLLDEVDASILAVRPPAPGDEDAAP